MPRTKVKTKLCDLCGRRHQKTPRQCLLGTRKTRGHGLLWKTLKQAMRLRDDHICQKCGEENLSGINEHMSHVYRGARCARLKYSLDNVKTLCAPCHRWWHEYEMEAVPWFRETWPIRAETLDAKIAEYRADPGTVSIGWYELQLEGLRDYIGREESQQAALETRGL